VNESDQTSLVAEQANLQLVWAQVSINVMYSTLGACGMLRVLFVSKGWAEVLFALQFSFWGNQMPAVVCSPANMRC